MLIKLSNDYEKKGVLMQHIQRTNIEPFWEEFILFQA